MNIIRRVVVSVCFVILGSQPVAGQSIHGRVLQEGDTLGLEGVELALLGAGDVVLHRASSDSVGAFRLVTPEAGTFRIIAARLGLATTTSEVRVLEKEIVVVELRMAAEAIPLEPILVTARRRIRQGTLDEFYDRMDRNRQRGVGWFFTRAEIEARESMRLPLFLNTAPGVYTSNGGSTILMRRRGEFCAPTVYLDGMETSYENLQMMDLEGVEIYRGRWESVGGYFPSDCGMVFLWRKPDWGHPFDWARVVMAGGLIALLVGLASLL